VPNTVARAVLLNDATIAPRGQPYVEVVAAAKVDLEPGQTPDGLGEFLTYGLAENTDAARSQGLLPMGLAEGCLMVRAVPKDQVLTFADVILPAGRLCDQLWHEQNSHFKLAAPLAVVAADG
jgi:predicted homoserine dehydrogenase-like protein